MESWVFPIVSDGDLAIRGACLGNDGARSLYVAARQRGTSTLATVGADEGERGVLARVSDRKVAWARLFNADTGPMAATPSAVVATLAASAAVSVDGVPAAIHGEPGALLLALSPANGATQWLTGVGATEWAIVSALAAVGDDVIVAGSFSGTLRMGTLVVSAAGNSDGFVARLGPGGKPEWMVRVGGAGADAAVAVAAAGDSIAVAGSIVGDGDIAGVTVEDTVAQSVTSDVFIAMLTGSGKPKWATALGGELDDSAAGVAITGRGSVLVAGTVRGSVGRALPGDSTLNVRGASDLLIAHRDASGKAVAATLIGGDDYDGARGLIARPDGFTAVGWFSGAVPSSAGLLTADGGDDALVVELDVDGQVAYVAASGDRSVITGAGREEVAAIAGDGQVQLMAIGYSASASAFAQPLPAPPTSRAGVALVVRSVAAP